MPSERIKVEKKKGTPEKLAINWCYPDIDEEKEEIIRTAMEFAGFDNDYREEISKIYNAIDRGRIQPLDEAMWSKLTNSDSFQFKLGQVEEAKAYALEAGKSPEGVDKILAGMRNGQPMQSPIIVIRSDGVPYLVSGNTRLMLARAVGDTPHVVIANMK